MSYSITETCRQLPLRSAFFMLNLSKIFSFWHIESAVARVFYFKFRNVHDTIFYPRVFLQCETCTLNRSGTVSGDRDQTTDPFPLTTAHTADLPSALSSALYTLVQFNFIPASSSHGCRPSLSKHRHGQRLRKLWH